MIIDRHEPVDLFSLLPQLKLKMEQELAELDHLLEDDALCRCIRIDLSRRHPNSETRGRSSTPV